MAEPLRAPWPCRDYNKNGCSRSGCTHTHICFKFVDPGSFCKEGKECNFNHNIFDTQVRHCLQKSGFDVKVKPNELRQAYSSALKLRKTSLPPRKHGPPPSAPPTSAPPIGQKQDIVNEIQRLTAMLNVTNVPRVCRYFNQGRCSNISCDCIHLCDPYVHRLCKNGFKQCPFSHDIFQPRVKDLLRSAGFNVNQPARGLIENYREALQISHEPVQGQQGEPSQQGRGRPPHSGRQGEPTQQGRGRPPHSGRLARTPKNSNRSQSYVDLRGESVGQQKSIKKRGPSARRKTPSRSGSGSDSDSDSFIGTSDGESSGEEITKTPSDNIKKKRNRRGGKKKQKAQGLNVPQIKSTGAIPKVKDSSGGQAGMGKPSTLHVSILEDATICVDFLKGCCQHEHCLSHHQDMPYLWQYKILQNGWKWKTFSKDNGQLLEQSFCNVSTTSCPLMLEGQMFRVDFEKMAASSPDVNLPVRRLTTAFYPDKTHHLSLLTHWRWYWESDEDWTECGRKVKSAKSSETNSAQIILEKAYQEDPSSVITIKMNDFKYKIDFPKMLQQNKESGTERRLRRRPIYMSPEDKAKVLSVEVRPGIEESLQLDQLQEALPSNWKPMPADKPEVILVDVPKDSMDYRDISVRFQLTLPNASIFLIKRIQNPTLWRIMNLKKNKMEREHGKGKAGDINLFHGTKPTAVNPICEQNFDWRLYGSATGTRYGKGVYFALQAEKADQYADSDENGLRFMFSARVLLGKYTEGNKSMKRPPPVDSSTPNRLFDSCTDNVSQPSVFVLFDKDQFYPEFVICYKK